MQQLKNEAPNPGKSETFVGPRRIFIVHGHDPLIKEMVARLLLEKGYHPIVLHEQANGGRTIIEKFEVYSDVAHAVILATGDDEGRSKTMKDSELQPRCRQNVLLELGFFLGRLGRRRTTVICEKDVEFPSDYDGIVLIEYDKNGAWKELLIKEIRSEHLL